MRLIDADAFDKMLIDAQSKCKKNGCNFRFGVLGNVRANLALFPTVDRPEIVRCEDCIHYRYYGLNEYPVSECTIDHCENPDEDWFCADGKRR